MNCIFIMFIYIVSAHYIHSVHYCCVPETCSYCRLHSVCQPQFRYYCGTHWCCTVQQYRTRHYCTVLKLEFRSKICTALQCTVIQKNTIYCTALNKTTILNEQDSTLHFTLLPCTCVAHQIQDLVPAECWQLGPPPITDLYTANTSSNHRSLHS